MVPGDPDPALRIPGHLGVFLPRGPMRNRWRTKCHRAYRWTAPGRYPVVAAASSTNTTS